MPFEELLELLVLLVLLVLLLLGRAPQPEYILIQRLATKDTLKPGDWFERQGQLESAGLSSGFSGSDT